MRSKFLAARLSLVALALVPAAACDDVIVDNFGSRGRLFGTVTNQAAAPVAGAGVRAEYLAPGCTAACTPEIISGDVANAQGEYEAVLPPESFIRRDGRYLLIAEAPAAANLRPDTAEFTPPNGPLRVRIDFRLDPR